MTSRIIFLCFVFNIATLAQTAAPETAQVPDGVRYKTATDKVNASASESLAHAFSGDKVSIDFFDTAVTCGPSLWMAMKPSADKALFESKEIVVFVNSVQTEARGFINAQRQSFWMAFLKKYPAVKTAKIRKANKAELVYYWATIFFDIEEPLFIIDIGSEKFIANFRIVDQKVVLFWIDLVGDLGRLSAPPGA